VRVKSVLIALLGLGHAVVLVAWELVTAGEEGQRPNLVVRIRPRARRRGRCGRCGAVAPWFDQGGGERRWRHIDVGFATCELVGDARRVACPTHGPTVAHVSFARHDSWFTRAFEDLVVYDAISSSKLAGSGATGSPGGRSTTCASGLPARRSGGWTCWKAWSPSPSTR